MRKSRQTLSLLLTLFALLPPFSFARENESTAPVAFEDSLLNRFTGTWRMVGTVMGDSVEYICEVDWVLNHRFLRWHLKDIQQPPGYEALVFIGWDDEKSRYVAHWLDVYGGKASRTLGFGTRNGNNLELLFDYPEGAFWDVLTFHPREGNWTFVIQQKNQQGLWKEFAKYRLMRPGPPATTPER